MTFHGEAMCVSLQIYLRNEKGRYMGEIMENYVFFFPSLSTASIHPLLPTVTHVT